VVQVVQRKQNIGRWLRVLLQLVASCAYVMPDACLLQGLQVLYGHPAINKGPVKRCNLGYVQELQVCLTTGDISKHQHPHLCCSSVLLLTAICYGQNSHATAT
jgi:hypothetical protein